MRDNLLEAVGLTKFYQIDERQIEVIKGVNLTLTSGETVAVIGPSGAGKSTLLHIIGLLEAPSDGKLSFDGEDIGSSDRLERAQMRLQRIGFVFQFHHLLPEFTAQENVMLPGLMAGSKKHVCMDRAAELLTEVGLSERFDHKPGELSGGEQQRVALARALMNRPSLILADEPTGNLDRDSSERLRKLLWDICRNQETTLLLVTHDETLSRHADRTFEMVDGTLNDYRNGD